MIVPSLTYRRTIDWNLESFFREHGRSAFKRAISQFCRFYHVRLPKIEWYEYIDWGKTAGKTYEDGQIHLVHPENWKRGRVYNSERMWIQMVYHEMGHYLFWTDAERKADAFTRRMVHGLRRVGERAARAASRAARPASRRKIAGKRQAAVRAQRKKVRLRPARRSNRQARG
jgi:hypothetical protein